MTAITARINGRDECQHGSLRRSCQTCFEVATARAEGEAKGKAEGFAEGVEASAKCCDEEYACRKKQAETPVSHGDVDAERRFFKGQARVADALAREIRALVPRPEAACGEPKETAARLCDGWVSSAKGDNCRRPLGHEGECVGLTEGTASEPESRVAASKMYCERSLRFSEQADKWQARAEKAERELRGEREGRICQNDQYAKKVANAERERDVFRREHSERTEQWLAAVAQRDELAEALRSMMAACRSCDRDAYPESFCGVCIIGRDALAKVGGGA